MTYLITIIVSIIVIFWWIKIANKYAYNGWDGKKIKVPNIVKILLYAVCIIPFLNVALAFILVTAISPHRVRMEGLGRKQTLILAI